MSTKVTYYLAWAFVTLINPLKTLTHVAVTSAAIWLVMKYVVEFEVGYVPLAGVIYIFGILSRSAAYDFKVNPVMVYLYKRINGRDYIYAADIQLFRKDIDIHSALEKKIRK